MSFVTKFQWRYPFAQAHRIQFLTRYLLPVVAVLLALQAHLFMAPHLTVLPPFLTFVAAIMVTAWYAGFASAMFATVLSTLVINYYFIPPIYDFWIKPADAATIAFFGLEAILMAYCIDYLRKNEGHLRQANKKLEDQVRTERQELSVKEERLRGLMYQLAVTEERERRQLAVELHDYLAQLLTLTRMKVKQAQQSLHRSPGESNQFIKETDELLSKSLDYVRTLMAELYPTQLHESGLPAAVRWLAGQMPKHGLTVDVSMTETPIALPADKALLLYQSVRELLMNIVKHAGVSRASVDLASDREWLRMTVEDTGRGFDPSALPETTSGHHFGLQSVRDRISNLGGTFMVDSAVGKGTRIQLRVPLVSLVRAASSMQQDRVWPKPPDPPNQQSLPI